MCHSLLTDGALSVLATTHQDGAVAATPVVRSERDVGAKDGACPSEEIFDVLPADSEGELD